MKALKKIILLISFLSLVSLFSSCELIELGKENANKSSNPTTPSQPSTDGDQPSQDPITTDPDSPVPVTEVKPGNLTVSDVFKNSVEVTNQGVNIDTAGKQLYTLTIHVPSEFNGQSTANYTITSSSATNKLVQGYNRECTELKPSSYTPPTIPTGEDRWSGIYVSRNVFVYQCTTEGCAKKGSLFYLDTGDTCPSCHNKFTAGGAVDVTQVTNGNFWFQDENNKVKYYITDEAKAGCYTTLSDSYWNECRDALNSSVLQGRNLLKDERDSFGLDEYDKDGTQWFYVLVDDFGDYSVNLSESGISGTAGYYSSKDIRDTDYSNVSDIFYVNSRYIEGFSEVLYRGLPAARTTACENAVNTLIHEYMHYLMDCNHLSGAEEEAGVSKGSIENGWNSFNLNSAATLFSSVNRGSLFWLEGCANYAPYRIIEQSDANAVKSWLSKMKSWRPDINANDTNTAFAGNAYPVYGAGGLFFSYIAAKYGDEKVNQYCQYRDTIADIKRRLEGKPIYTQEVMQNVVGDINIITRSVLDQDFRNTYLNFLCQLMSSLSEDSTIKGCADSLPCAADWGFNKDNVDTYANQVYGTSAQGVLNQLSFSIDKWSSSPSRLTLSGDTGKIKCYAIWI